MSEELSTTESAAPQATDAQPINASPEAAPSVAVAAGSGTEITGKESQDPAASPQETQAPAYVPNYKFKSYDKEHEMEEWVRPFIKSKDDEEKFRKLFCKAVGVDYMTEKNNDLRSNFTEVYRAHEATQQGINKLKKSVSERDFDSFFKQVNIPPEWIYEWVKGKVKYQSLPEDQKRLYDESIAQRQRAAELEEQHSATRSELEQAQTRTKQFELDMALSKPDVSQIVRDFDSTNGRVGAFRDQVVVHGYSMEQLTGKPVSAEEATISLLRLMGKAPGQPQPGVMSQTTVTPPVSTSPQEEKPVIPNIKARGGSPVKKQPKNLQEMREQIRDRLSQINT